MTGDVQCSDTGVNVYKYVIFTMSSDNFECLKTMVI